MEQLTDEHSSVKRLQALVLRSKAELEPSSTVPSADTFPLENLDQCITSLESLETLRRQQTAPASQRHSAKIFRFEAPEDSETPELARSTRTRAPTGPPKGPPVPNVLFLQNLQRLLTAVLADPSKTEYIEKAQRTDLFNQRLQVPELDSDEWLDDLFYDVKQQIIEHNEKAMAQARVIQKTANSLRNSCTMSPRLPSQSRGSLNSPRAAHSPTRNAEFAELQTKYEQALKQLTEFQTKAKQWNCLAVQLQNITRESESEAMQELCAKAAQIQERAPAPSKLPQAFVRHLLSNPALLEHQLEMLREDLEEQQQLQRMLSEELECKDRRISRILEENQKLREGKTESGTEYTSPKRTRRLIRRAEPTPVESAKELEQALVELSQLRADLQSHYVVAQEMLEIAEQQDTLPEDRLESLRKRLVLIAHELSPACSPESVIPNELTRLKQLHSNLAKVYVTVPKLLEHLSLLADELEDFQVSTHADEATHRACLIDKVRTCENQVYLEALHGGWKRALPVYFQSPAPPHTLPEDPTVLKEIIERLKQVIQSQDLATASEQTVERVWVCANSKTCQLLIGNLYDQLIGAGNLSILDAVQERDHELVLQQVNYEKAIRAMHQLEATVATLKTQQVKAQVAYNKLLSRFRRACTTLTPEQRTNLAKTDPFFAKEPLKSVPELPCQPDWYPVLNEVIKLIDQEEWSAVCEKLQNIDQILKQRKEKTQLDCENISSVLIQAQPSSRGTDFSRKKLPLASIKSYRSVEEIETEELKVQQALAAIHDQMTSRRNHKRSSARKKVHTLHTNFATSLEEEAEALAKLVAQAPPNLKKHLVQAQAAVAEAIDQISDTRSGPTTERGFRKQSVHSLDRVAWTEDCGSVQSIPSSSELRIDTRSVDADMEPCSFPEPFSQRKLLIALLLSYRCTVLSLSAAFRQWKSVPLQPQLRVVSLPESESSRFEQLMAQCIASKVKERNANSSLQRFYQRAVTEGTPFDLLQTFTVLDDFLRDKTTADLEALRDSQLPVSFQSHLSKYFASRYPLPAQSMGQCLLGLKTLADQEHPYAQLYCTLLGFDSDLLLSLHFSVYIARFRARLLDLVHQTKLLRNRGCSALPCVDRALEHFEDLNNGGRVFLYKVLELLYCSMDPDASSFIADKLCPSNLSEREYVSYLVCHRLKNTGMSTERLLEKIEKTADGHLLPSAIAAAVRGSLGVCASFDFIEKAIPSAASVNEFLNWFSLSSFKKKRVSYLYSVSVCKVLQILVKCYQGLQLRDGSRLLKLLLSMYPGKLVTFDQFAHFIRSLRVTVSPIVLRKLFNDELRGHSNSLSAEIACFLVLKAGIGGYGLGPFIITELYNITAPDRLAPQHLHPSKNPASFSGSRGYQAPKTRRNSVRARFNPMN